MAMGKRRRRAKQTSMWVATQDLPRSAAHPFYARLNQILDQHDFDGYVEGKMKDGRTNLAHKTEHAVDLETVAIVGVTVQDADDGDTATSIETLIEAAEQVETVQPNGDGPKEVVGDKGYHSNQSLVDLEAVGVRS
jgi:hypothetical protein